MHTDLIKVKNDYENSWGNLNVEAAMPSQCGRGDTLLSTGCYKT